MKSERPTELELQVLSVLWEHGPCTVRQVLDAIPDGKKRAYTTILSVMQVMEKKGLLRKDTQGISHIYKPTQNRRAILGPMLRKLVHNVFGGKSSAAIQQLLANTEISEEELSAIDQLIEQKRKQQSEQK